MTAINQSKKWSWWWVPALIPVLLFAQCYHWRHSYTREDALREAMIEMKTQCNRHCAEYGLKIEDLRGPVESLINHEPEQRHFEFTWTAPDGTELFIMVADNGLIIDIDQWWLNTPELRRLQEKAQIKGRSKEPG